MGQYWEDKIAVFELAPVEVCVSGRSTVVKVKFVRGVRLKIQHMLKGLCHDDFVVLGQFFTKIVT